MKPSTPYSMLPGNGYKQLQLMNAGKHHLTYAKGTDEISMPVGIFLTNLNAARATAYGQLFDKPSPLVTGKMAWQSDVDLPPYMQGYYEAYRAYITIANSDYSFREAHGIADYYMTWGTLHRLRTTMEGILEPVSAIPARGMTLPYTALAMHFNEVVLPSLQTNGKDALRIFARHIQKIHAIGEPVNPREHEMFKETGAYIEVKR